MAVDLDLFLTSFHEAGHAVAGLRRGFKLRYVSIVPDYRNGRAGVTVWHEEREGRKPRRVYDDVVLTLAGRAAAERIIPEAGTWGAERDIAQARAMVRSVPKWRGRPVYRRALDAARRAVHHPAAWGAVRAVALALMERRTLSGRQVGAILRRRELARG